MFRYPSRMEIQFPGSMVILTLTAHERLQVANLHNLLVVKVSLGREPAEAEEESSNGGMTYVVAAVRRSEEVHSLLCQ